MQSVFLLATLPSVAVTVGAMIVLLWMAKKRQLLFH